MNDYRNTVVLRILLHILVQQKTERHERHYKHESSLYFVMFVMSFVVVLFFFFCSFFYSSTKNELQMTHNSIVSDVFIMYFLQTGNHTITVLAVRLNDKVNEKSVDF